MSPKSSMVGDLRTAARVADRTRGTIRASSGRRDLVGVAGASGKVTVTGGPEARTRGRRLTRRWPAPSGRVDAGEPPGTRSWSRERPTSSVAVGSIATGPTTGAPSSRVPLLECRSVTVTCVDSTRTIAWTRETSGSSRRSPAPAALPSRCSPGGNRNTWPASGPETTCSSSTPGASR